MMKDKRWIEVTQKNSPKSVWREGNDTIGYTFCIVDNTLLDQLRRDAVEDYKKTQYGKELHLISFTRKENSS